MRGTTINTPEHISGRAPGGQRLFTAALALCLLIALATRWLFLGAESLWFDEGWTWWLVSNPAGDLLRLMRADTVAPLYFYLLRGWVLLFGDDVVAMRAMSALLVTLALVPWWIIARRTLSSRVALLTAAALVAISFMCTQYAREVRPYALLALLSMIAVACIEPAVARSRRSWPAMIGFAVCVAGSMYTHNAMGFYAVCLALAWLIWPGERPMRSRMADLAIAVVISIVLYLPWLPSMREQARWIGGNFWASRPTAVHVGQVVSTVSGIDVFDVSFAFHAVFRRSPGVGTLAVFVTACAGAACALSMMTSDKAARRRALALSLITFGPLLMVFVYSRFAQPIFLGRLFMTSAMLLPLVVGLSLEHARRRSTRVAAGAIALSLGVLGAICTVTYLSTPQKEDWRGTQAYVASLPPEPRRVIVFLGAEGELPFMYYATRDPQQQTPPRTGAPAAFFSINPPRTMQRIRAEDDISPMRADLESGGYREAVLILSHQYTNDPKGLTLDWFERNWTRGEERKLRHVKVVRFHARDSIGHR